MRKLFSLTLSLVMILSIGVANNVVYGATEGEPFFSVIAAGGNHTVAIKADGSLWAWGNNEYGQIGNGGVSDSTDAWGTIMQSTPVQIGTDNNWVSVVAAQNHTVAIKVDGSLWAWGSNSSGQLGNGGVGDNETEWGEIYQSIPIQIGTDNDWASVAANLSHTLAIKEDGSLWSWGYNGYGGFDITPTVSNTPVRFGTDSDWASVSTNRHTVAIKIDGSLWAWGWNHSGQLGDGTIKDRTEPAQIGTDTDWISAVAGTFNTFAIKADGSLWGWGYGEESGQIGTDNDWVSVAANGERNNWNRALAIRADGSLWTWGTWEHDEDWNAVYIDTPVRVGTDNNWATVEVGCWGAYAIALKKNGSIWGWGSELPGQAQIGNGAIIHRSEPASPWATNWQEGDTLYPEYVDEYIVHNIKIGSAGSQISGNVDFKANLINAVNHIEFYVAIYDSNNKLVSLYHANTDNEEVRSLIVSDVPEEHLNKNIKLMIWDKNTMEPYIEAVSNF